MTIYCLCDDFLRAWGYEDDPRAETTPGTLTGWMGRRLHALTPRGLELKVGLTVLAYAMLA